MIQTVLQFPYFNIYIIFLYCKNPSYINAEMTCYSAVHLIHFVLAIIGIIIALINIVIFSFLYGDLNPFS